jgi:hypothetical protein
MAGFFKTQIYTGLTLSFILFWRKADLRIDGLGDLGVVIISQFKRQSVFASAVAEAMADKKAAPRRCAKGETADSLFLSAQQYII